MIVFSKAAENRLKDYPARPKEALLTFFSRVEANQGGYTVKVTLQASSQRPEIFTVVTWAGEQAVLAFEAWICPSSGRVLLAARPLPQRAPRWSRSENTTQYGSGLLGPGF